MKKIIILLLILSQTAFGFVSLRSVDDKYFPEMIVEFDSDFQFETHQIYVYENAKEGVAVGLSSVQIVEPEPCEFVIFIDTSDSNEENFGRIIDEVSTFRMKILDSHQNASVRVLTNSKFTNDNIMKKKRNIFLLNKSNEEFFEDVIRYRGMNSNQINFYMDYISEYEYSFDRKLVFIFFTNGREISQNELSQVPEYLRNLNKCQSDLYVFTDTDMYYTEYFYKKLLDNIHGGAIYNIKTDSLNTVYERYFNENNYRHIISYTSTLERIESDYSLKMIFPEQNMTYDLKIILPFYENLKINSFTACPFIVEMEGSVCLSCLTSIKDGVDYTWYADFGEFLDSGKHAGEIYWKAPERKGFYKITVRCEYEGSVRTSSIFVRVE